MQNNATRTNYVKAKIYDTQENSKCRIYDNWEERVNHLLCECSKMAQKEDKRRHDWIDKMIYRELCKRLKFGYTNKWYIHKPEFVQDNEMHKFSGTNKSVNPGQKGWLSVNTKKKKTLRSKSVKIKENEKIVKYLDLARELKSSRT